ncbi:MAG: hypothetical protein RJQ21_16345 [Rhodospirillales bacterium]
MNHSGPLLRSSAHNEYRPLGVMGQPVYMNHRKIVAAVQSRLGGDFTDYLARPEIDEANRRIHWHAAVDGPVRRWDELSEAEQQAAAPKIAEMRDGFLRFVGDLEARETNNRSEQGFAHLARQALRSPGTETLYMVGDRPVLTLWGFEGDGAPFDTLTFSPVGGARPAIQAAAAAVPVAAASRPWWRWLLWLLMVLLLLALLAWILRYCGQLPDDLPFIDDRRTEEIDPANPDDPDRPVEPEILRGPNGEILVPGPDGVLVPAPDGTIVPPGTGEGTLPGDQPQPGDQPLPGTEPGEPEIPPTPDQPAPGEGETPPVPDQPTEPETPQEPPAPDQPQDQPEQPQPEPPQDQPQPDQPQDQPQPDDPGNQPPQDQPQDQPGDNGQPLEVPPAGSPNAGNGGVGFMQGTWKSDGGLVDEKTGRPLDQRYDFDDQGQGEVIIRQGDGTECRGGASATRTPDGGLRITETGPVACGDGSVYAPSVTDCKPAANGKTICTGINPDGSRYQVEVTR